MKQQLLVRMWWIAAVLLLGVVGDQKPVGAEDVVVPGVTSPSQLPSTGRWQVVSGPLQITRGVFRPDDAGNSVKYVFDVTPKQKLAVDLILFSPEIATVAATLLVGAPPLAFSFLISLGALGIGSFPEAVEAWVEQEANTARQLPYGVVIVYEFRGLPFFALAGSLVPDGSNRPTTQNGTGALSSTMTASTTSQVLNLNATVTRVTGGNFRWTFSLANPSGNTSQIRVLTISPGCVLNSIGQISDPPGWTHVVIQVDTSGRTGIMWYVPLTVPNPQQYFLPAGRAFTYSFVLDHGADPLGLGLAAAIDTYAFGGPTLGCQ